ncbi:MAG: hypothetical protein GY764_15815 [Halieaceae bacterium]|nr:hypothetical protein [Halieaceae bacterium]
MKWTCLLAFATVLFLVTGARAFAQDGGTFELTWYSVDGGSTTALTGGTFELGSTAGQSDAAGLAGGTFTLNGGFWQCFLPASVTDVAIDDAGGGTAQLGWSGSGLYDVWRSGDPYFGAGDGGSTQEVDDVTSPHHVPGAIGDPANNHYFLVLAQTGCGTSGPSNRTGEFDFALIPGS